MTEDEAKWKRRFEAFSTVRLSALVLVVLGLLVAFRNPVGDEFPAVGGLIGLGGLALLFFGQRALRRHWEREDAA